MLRIITPKLKWLSFTVLALSCFLIELSSADNLIDEYDGNSGRYNIEGKVYAPELFSSSEFNWQQDTAITINDGEYSAFLKDDGTFIISGVPSGSYVVEISNPDYYYESVKLICHAWTMQLGRVQERDADNTAIDSNASFNIYSHSYAWK